MFCHSPKLKLSAGGDECLVYHSLLYIFYYLHFTLLTAKQLTDNKHDKREMLRDRFIRECRTYYFYYTTIYENRDVSSLNSFFPLLNIILLENENFLPSNWQFTSFSLSRNALLPRVLKSENEKKELHLKKILIPLFSQFLLVIFMLKKKIRMWIEIKSIT